MPLNRFAQHWARRGSTFTKQFKPIAVEQFIYPASSTTERDKTPRYIQTYGFSCSDGSPKVRGAAWASLTCQMPKNLESNLRFLFLKKIF